MTTLEANWVTPATDDDRCDRCLVSEDILALKLIYDQPTYLCRDCLEDAAAIAFGRMWMRR